MSEWSTTRGERVLAVSGVFTCLATVLTALREYTRACIVKKIGADDYAVLVALVCSTRSLTHRYLLTNEPGLLMGLLRAIRWRFVASFPQTGR